ncbi:hypothetical protein D3C81_491300 [compost metagenome]
MATLAKSGALRIWSLSTMAVWLLPSLKKPSGEATLAARMALRRSSGLNPNAFIARRLRSMRTAGVDAPAISTCDTPGSCRSRCASSESAMLYSSATDCVSEVSASAITGSSLGLAFWYVGVPMPAGRSAMAALIAACTSCAAESMSRLVLNIKNTMLRPSLLLERMVSMPGTWPRWRSSGAVTVEAMVLASAPMFDACTKITGMVRLGRAATPRRR